MKRYILILVFLFCYCVTSAQTITEKQTGICFNKIYFAEKRPHLFFFISLFEEDGEGKAIIFNQYAKVFKPVFDVRGFELTLLK